jgi:hypothetical protein
MARSTGATRFGVSRDATSPLAQRKATTPVPTSDTFWMTRSRNGDRKITNKTPMGHTIKPK